MANVPDTTTLEYSYGGFPVLINSSANTAILTAASSFGDVSYLGVPAAPIYDYLADAGTVTAVADLSGSTDTIADAPPTSTTTVTDGTLGNNATHESYVTDIVYVEAYTLTTSAIVQSYQWQGKGDNSHADQHWKFLIYLDNGGVPGALLYVSDEQTVSSVGSTVTTQSISPTALSIPSGTLWVGVHLNEGHLAPTYTHGGNALDASDEYDDGPNDPFSGGGNTNDNLRDRLLTYIPNAANVALAILTGSSSLTVPASAAATVTAVAVLAGAEALLEQTGNVTAVAVLSGSETLSAGDQTDTGSITATESDSALEALVDAGSVTAVAVVASADTLTDASSLTAVASLSAAEALADATTVTAVAVISVLGGVPGVDTGLVTSLAGPFTSAAFVSPLLFSGTVTSIVVLSDAERSVDTGSLTVVAVPTGADKFNETATLTVTAVITVTEFVGDGQIIAAGVLLTQQEALTQAATLTAIADPEGSQQSVGDGQNVFVVAVLGVEEALADQATEIATADITSPFSSVAWTMTGECDATAVITGFGFEDSRTGSKKGFAYPSMTLRYRSDPEDARVTR